MLDEVGLYKGFLLIFRNITPGLPSYQNKHGDSSLSQILFAQYFSRSSILQAHCPARGSFTWRNIHHGRDLLADGLIWRLGDGSHVDIWESNWIPRASAQRPLGRKCETTVKKVSELLNGEGTGWDTQKLDWIFHGADSEDIKSVVVGGMGSDDYHAWNHTKNGVFSVRSAYHLGMRMKKLKAGMSACVNPLPLRLLIRAGSLYGGPCSRQSKIHVRRLVKNGLAVRSELQHRKIKAGVRCVACDREETAIHRFWQCPHSMKTWEHIRDTTIRLLGDPPANVRTHRDLTQWMLEWLGTVKASDMDITMMVLYQLWLARNSARETRMMENPELIAKRALHLIEEWQNIQNPKPAQTPVQKERWQNLLEMEAEEWLPVTTMEATLLVLNIFSLRFLILRKHSYEPASRR